MTREELIADLQDKFSDHIREFVDKSVTRVFITIDPDALPELVAYVFSVLGARFHIASGVDTQSHFEILYHFSIEDLNVLISLRVKLERDQPAVQSIVNIVKGAEWIEREIHELLGINFVDHPNLRRLLLPEQWPEGVYPLRRDYEEWDDEAIRDRGV